MACLKHCLKIIDVGQRTANFTCRSPDIYPFRTLHQPFCLFYFAQFITVEQQHGKMPRQQNTHQLCPLRSSRSLSSCLICILFFVFSFQVSITESSKTAVRYFSQTRDCFFQLFLSGAVGPHLWTASCCFSKVGFCLLCFASTASPDLVASLLFISSWLLFCSVCGSRRSHCLLFSVSYLFAARQLVGGRVFHLILAVFYTCKATVRRKPVSLRPVIIILPRYKMMPVVCTGFETWFTLLALRKLQMSFK